MADQDFVVSVGGEQFFTGLIAPEKVENVFLSYPPKQCLSWMRSSICTPTRSQAWLGDLHSPKAARSQSSCASYAATTSCEARRAFDRKVDVEFGPEYLYSLVNGGRDQGSQLKDNMTVLLDKVVPFVVRFRTRFTISNDLSMEQSDSQLKRRRTIEH